MAATTATDEVQSLREENAALRAQIAWLKKKLFGPGQSETLERAQLLLQLGELEQLAGRAAAERPTEHRNWRLFAEVAGVLMRRARRLHAGEPAPLDLDGDLFALDATLIDLSLALFPWARWQGTQAALKR